MKRKSRDEYARLIWPPLELAPEWRDLIRRRTQPFLDSVGLNSRSLSFVLEEVYMQGLKDAAQVFTAINRREPA